MSQTGGAPISLLPLIPTANLSGLTLLVVVDPVQGITCRATLAQLVGTTSGYFPTTIGLPTDVPPTVAGQVPMRVDISADPPTTCVYVGGAWKYTGAALG